MNLIRFIFTSTGVLLLSAFLCEAALQGFHYFHHRHWLFLQNPYTVSYVKATGDLRRYTLAAGFHDGKYTINEEQYRGEPIAGDPDVLFLGDSVPFGAGIRDAETYPFYYSRKYGKKVINGGVPSYGLQQSLARLRKNFGNLNPGAVVIHAVNDISLVTFYQKEWDPEKSWLGQRWLKSGSAAGAILSKSALVYYTTQALNISLMNKRQESYGAPDEETKRRFAEWISKIADEMVAESVKKDMPIIFVPANPFYYMSPENFERNKELSLWNALYVSYSKSLHDVMLLYNAILKEKAARSGEDKVYFFDITSLFDERDREGLYIDYFHHTPKGNQLFAEYLHEFLQNNLTPAA